MKEIGKIIEALRCQVGVGPTCEINCEYLEIDEIKEKDFERFADFEKDGKYYCYGCNQEQAVSDATDTLMELEKAGEKFGKLKTSLFKTCNEEGDKTRALPEGEEKAKHAYACKTIFGILTECGIDTEYER